jgi:hypothetical protein
VLLEAVTYLGSSKENIRHREDEVTGNWKKYRVFQKQLYSFDRIHICINKW